MPAQVSPILLSAYLAAAGRQVLSETKLSERSRWALAQGRYQLEAACDVLTGKRPFLETSASGALRQLSAGRQQREAAAESPHLAEVVLRVLPGGTLDDELEAREKNAAQRINRVLEAFEAIEDDAQSARATEAAELVCKVFAEASRRQAA
jgi:hypothetical protein